MAKSSDDAQTFVPDSETRCCTRSTYFSHRHTWTIKNYSFHEKDKILRSSKFSASGFDDTDWRIELHPRGSRKMSRGYISIFLCLDKCAWESVRVKFKFVLLDAKQQEIEQGQDLRTMKRGEDWGFYEFVKGDDVMDRLRQLCNDELSVRCDMWVAVQTVNIPIEVSPIPSKTSKRRAANILREFLGNQSSEDGASTVPTKGSRVREEVLKTFSPVLKAIFERDFVGTGPSREEISEMDENTFVQFVRFIYADDAKAPDNITKYLLAAIDKYALEESSPTAEHPETLEASSPKPNDEDVTTEAERLQACGAAANESHFVSAYEIPMQEEEEMVDADRPGGGVDNDPENDRRGTQANHPHIQQEKGHTGEESENDSHSSKFSVLEDC